MEQDKIQYFCEDYYWKQGLYYLGQSSALLGQIRLSIICQPWFRPSLIFPSALLLLNSGNLVALVMAAVPVADTPEDISQSSWLFWELLSLLHIAKSATVVTCATVAIPPPSDSSTPAAGTTQTQSVPVPSCAHHARTQGSTSLSICKTPSCATAAEERAPEGRFRDAHTLLLPYTTHEKSTAPKRSNQLQIARETGMSNKYFSFHNRT